MVTRSVFVGPGGGDLRLYGLAGFDSTSFCPQGAARVRASVFLSGSVDAARQNDASEWLDHCADSNVSSFSAKIRPLLGRDFEHPATLNDSDGGHSCCASDPQ